MIAAAFVAALAGTSCQKEQAKTAALTPDAASLKDMISENGKNPDDLMLSDASARSVDEAGYVYTESNDAAQNSILMYKQNTDGTLTYESSTASGGKGNSAGLGSQGAVIIDAQHQYLYAVNAGDNSISSFWIHTDGSLTLAHTIGSEGVTPISLTAHEKLMYVVNLGSDNIAGFNLGDNGTLSYIEASKQSLSAIGSGPAEIKFQPEGYALFVTEKNTNKIGMYTIGESGAANAATFANSVGATPYGFDFVKDKNFMIVSNAAGGVENAGSCTSYSTYSAGIVTDINGAVNDNQSAPCWIATTYYGRYAYTSNTASNTISVYYVSPSGKLYLIPFATAASGDAPIDITVSANNRFFYSLNSKSYSIGEFKRGLLGTLTNNGSITGLPPFAAGLACY